MKPYKVVIFDLDGTLADTSEGIYNSIRFAQKTMNLKEITLEQMRSHIGPPLYRIIRTSDLRVRNWSMQ